MRRILRKAISFALCFSGISKITSLLFSRGTIILVYHRIMDKNTDFKLDSSLISASPRNFEKQMKYLAKSYNVISLEEFIRFCKEKTRPPRNSVIITFDDGYKDNYLNAYPLLKRYGLPATIFLAAGLIDNQELFWWEKVAFMINSTSAKKIDNCGLGRFNLRNRQEKMRAIRGICLRLKDTDEKNKERLIELLSKALGVIVPIGKISTHTLLSWDEVSEMSKGGISFGAHTLTHPILTNLPKEEAEREIVGSKKAVERVLGDTVGDTVGKNVISFSYPNGYSCDFNEEIKDYLKVAGFECAVTYMQGRNHISSDLFELKRIPVRYEDDLCSFKNKLAGLEIIPSRIYCGLARLAGRKRI